MVDFDRLGRKIAMGGKQVGQKIMTGVKSMGQKLWQNKGKLIGGALALGVGTWLGGDKWKGVVGGPPRQSGMSREEEWIYRDLGKSIPPVKELPPPTYSQLFPKGQVWTTPTARQPRPLTESEGVMGEWLQAFTRPEHKNL